MRHKSSVVFLLLLALSSGAAAQSSTMSSAATRILQDISFLADDARQGRGVGTAGLDAAAEYIADRFAEIGLAWGADGGFLQPFTISESAPAAAHAGLGSVPVRNVVGIIPGKGALKGQAVVVGAHYDHLGYGGFGSLDPDSVDVVHNGADDNASGTAVMIEIARTLREKSGDNVRTFVFVAFTAEELGLIGSDYYVKNPALGNDSTFAMVNLDMVGRMVENRVAAFGAETAEEFPSLLDSINADYQLTIAASGDGFGRSDQQSFFTQKIPVLHFFTGSHEDYHRTSDDTALINADGAATVASFVADLTWALATRRAPLSFVDAEPPTMTTSGGYGAYLGSIPDMTESPGGVRLTGVRAGSPADDAGIEAGDILIGIGDFTITDLYEMTDALRAYKPGDRVVIRLRRGDEVIEVEATLGRRGG